MSLNSKWLFIILGNNCSGKTTLQKKIIRLISDENYDSRLECNVSVKITHTFISRKIDTISFSNRSYQEKIGDYKSIENYFANHFMKADICVISSHLVPIDVEQMILWGHKLFFNVCGVFMSNSIDNNQDLNSQISALGWDSRIISNNPLTDIPEQQDKQLQIIANDFIMMLIHKAIIL
jgi:hypothetical protein